MSALTEVADEGAITEVDPQRCSPSQPIAIKGHQCTRVVIKGHQRTRVKRKEPQVIEALS